MNVYGSGRIFPSLLHSWINILPLFTATEKNNVFCLVHSYCTHKKVLTKLDLQISRRKPFKVNLIDILKCEFTLAILFCLDHALIMILNHAWKTGYGNICQS